VGVPAMESVVAVVEEAESDSQENGLPGSDHV
jgi:hypothetical protein